jgi:hypothetical protein
MLFQPSLQHQQKFVKKKENEKKASFVHMMKNFSESPHTPTSITTHFVYTIHFHFFSLTSHHHHCWVMASFVEKSTREQKGWCWIILLGGMGGMALFQNTHLTMYFYLFFSTNISLCTQVVEGLFCDDDGRQQENWAQKGGKFII